MPTATKPLPRALGVPARVVARKQRHALLFFAFAFAVMADPVSSVAYAIEAPLRALDGHLSLLFPTMCLVIAVDALIAMNYWHLIARFPQGGGGAEAAARAFGTAWVFVPIGALVVDFVLTIAISIAAAGSALIAYLPGTAQVRIPIALGLLLFVAALTWFGHRGRLVFALMTSLFIVASIIVLALGWVSPSESHGSAPLTGHALSPPLLAILLAFPVAMALATGMEAAATAIAQLGQLDDSGRRRFGQATVALTIVIVGALTLGLTALAVHLNVGIPKSDSTQIADLAKVAAGGGAIYAFFQLTSSMLLLAAASSSFQAGPGLLKALARREDGGGVGVLPRFLGRTNSHYTPYFAVLVYLVVSALVILAASGKEQELVLVYAVAVFVSFFAGLAAMARFAWREGRRFLFVLNSAGCVVVAFTIAVDIDRGWPLLALAATALIGAALYGLWVRSGRPTGIEQIERHAEADEGDG
jgi:hypothetical protein